MVSGLKTAFETTECGIKSISSILSLAVMESEINFNGLSEGYIGNSRGDFTIAMHIVNWEVIVGLFGL